MSFDLHWLSAPDEEVAAAMARVRRSSRPAWVPTKRQVLVHVDHCLMLWYLCIVWMVFGVRIDTLQDNAFTSADIRAIVVTSLIFIAWIGFTLWLYRWAARPPSPRSRLREWRQILTALTNGFEPSAARRATFESMITETGRDIREYPRFAAQGVEFGNLRYRNVRRAEWHYVAVTLPAPLPHLVLDAASAPRAASDLPVGVGRGQRLSLEGDFDRWFRLHVPGGYERDALFLLTPDVMAQLVDTASAFHIEAAGDRLVFFTSPAADFARPEVWTAVADILTGPATSLAAGARRYRDERVDGQERSRTVASVRAALERPDETWVEPQPIIAPDGRRLRLHRRWRQITLVLGAAGWIATLAFLYAVPGIFAFAGFMSVVDGR